MSALTLICNARVTSPHPDSPLNGQLCDLLLGGGKVLAIGAPAAFGTVPVSQRLDVQGRHLVPGLVDAHVHLGGGGGEGGFHTRVPRVEIASLIEAGVTSVVGVLGTDGATRTMRELVACAYAMRAEGLSAWCYTGNYHIPVVTLTGSVKDDLVFIDPIIGVGELALSDHRSSQPTFDELLRVASEAYVGGLTAKKPGIMHLHMGDGARGLELVKRALAETELPARIWQPTHLNRNPHLWDEAKEMARQAKAPLFDVTAFPKDEEDEDTVPAARALLEWREANLPWERLSLSSDGGGCLPVFHEGAMVGMGVGSSETLLETLRELLAAGVPLAEALAPMTLHPARALGLAKGTIEVGADADLLVLSDAWQPWLVMARGEVMMDAGALTKRGRGTFGQQPKGHDHSRCRH